jgi:hypothetical protein
LDSQRRRNRSDSQHQLFWVRLSIDKRPRQRKERPEPEE